MVDQDAHQTVEVSDGERVIASAQVDTWPATPDMAWASLHAEAGHLPTGSRASLVDAVLDLPELQGSTHLKASMPLGDAESLQRLRERTDHMTTRAAGSTALVDAHLPHEPVVRSEVGPRTCATVEASTARLRDDGTQPPALSADHPALTRIESVVSLLFSAGLAMSSLQQKGVSSQDVQGRVDAAVAALDQAVHELQSLAIDSIDR